MNTPQITHVHDRPIPANTNGTARMGVQGSITVQKWDREGRRVPVRIDRNRKAWQRIWDHHQHNLITDAGMDYIMGGASQALRFSGALAYIAVGSGSGTPDVTDTALGNELLRTNQTLGLGTHGVESRPSTGVTRYRAFRAFDFNQANGDIREYGASSGPSDSILTRELFRNEGDDPITITKTSDNQLGITYDFDVTTGPTSLTTANTITIAGLGAYDLDFMFYRGAGSSFSYVGSSSALSLVPATAIGTTFDVASAITAPVGISLTTSLAPLPGSQIQTYTGGTFARTWISTYGAQVSGANLVGFALTQPSNTANNRYDLCAWRYNTPDVLAKDAAYRYISAATLTLART